MDKKFIKALLETGKKVSEMPKDEAVAMLNNEIMRVYILNGLHRNMGSEAFKQEVAACAVNMYNDFVSDSKYVGIRDKEVP